MSALIRARGLSAGYAGNAVVREVDLEVNPGEVVVLLGPNGAGKSTTVMSMAGALPPLSGTVEFLGRDVAEPLHRRARRGLALVTEERSVFMGLSVQQNLGLGRCDLGRVESLFPELGPLMRRRAGLLSGGEQQMLTLGRALARPGVRMLIADELSLGLAPKAVTRLLEAVRSAADHDGVGVLLVEQHVHRVLQYADKVHVVAQGRIRYTASSAEARENIDDIRRHYLSVV